LKITGGSNRRLKTASYEELNSMYCSPNHIPVDEDKAGKVYNTHDRSKNCVQSSVVNPEREKPLRRARRQ
jgi:hypothetical protein